MFRIGPAGDVFPGEVFDEQDELDVREGGTGGEGGEGAVEGVQGCEASGLEAGELLGGDD